MSCTSVRFLPDTATLRSALGDSFCNDRGPRITPLCGDKIDELENPAASLQRSAVRKTFCPARSLSGGARFI
jgi:hypothetical protein